jgi:hypothetical protein
VVNLAIFHQSHFLLRDIFGFLATSWMLLHAHKVVSAKTDMFCAMCKKEKKIGAKISISRDIILSFLHRVQKNVGIM